MTFLSFLWGVFIFVGFLISLTECWRLANESDRAAWIPLVCMIAFAIAINSYMELP
jgi:hypothetical protein